MSTTESRQKAIPEFVASRSHTVIVGALGHHRKLPRRLVLPLNIHESWPHADSIPNKTSGKLER